MNHLNKVSTYLATSPKGVTEEREFTDVQLTYVGYTVDANGKKLLNRETAQRLVDAWSVVGEKDGYRYALPEEMVFSAYHVHEPDGTILRVMTQYGHHHDEPITGWSLIHDLTTGKAHYRHNDGRQHPCY